MAKRRCLTGTHKVEHYLKDGRGQGRGKDYKPWLQIQDLPSRGLTTRIKGWKTGREHHLFSKLETSVFYILDWSLKVIDIREQFPLLPVEQTQEIAEKCGFRHPEDPHTKQPLVMTTDFLVTLRSHEGETNIVRAIKSSAELQSQRTLEKLEIERIYWKNHNTDWAIVTEKEILKNLVNNLEWLHPRYFLEDLNPLDKSDVLRIHSVLTPLIIQGKETLSKLTNFCDNQLGLEAGTSLSVARHLIANRHWLVDMNQPIKPSHKLVLLEDLTAEMKSNIGDIV